MQLSLRLPGDIMQEINIGGVFVPAQFMWAGAAFLLSSLLGRLLSRSGFYALIWHPALFDFSVFVIFWAVIASFPYRMAFSNVASL
jgi:hypothetical protein